LAAEKEEEEEEEDYFTQLFPAQQNRKAFVSEVVFLI